MKAFLPRNRFRAPRRTRVSCAAVTWVEIVFGICVIGAIAIFAAPAIYQKYLAKGCTDTQTMSNLRQLHMAMQQMALDHQTTGDPILWTCEGTVPITYARWKQTLEGEYFQPGDLDKLLTAPGPIKDAYTVFAVTDEDRGNTVLFASKNWQGPESKHLTEMPFKKLGFVVFRKDGSGTVLKEKQASDTKLIGGGGMHGYLPLK